MFTNKDKSLNVDEHKFLSLKDKEFNEWEIPPWNLIINTNDIIGEGEFGKVYMAKWNHTQVVAKVINDNVPIEKKDLFIKELDILTRLHHPNIVQFLGYVSNPFIIVMEYLPQGELLKFINNNRLLTNKKKLKICLDILRAIAYLHNRKPNYVIHRDIKPQNIVLSPSGKAKLLDFGISRVFKNYLPKIISLENITSDYEGEETKEETDLTKFVGSVRYMSPEIKDSNIYTFKTDIWSAGIIFAELFENQRYNTEFTWLKTPKKIKEIILNHMIKTNPEERLSAGELIDKLENIKINTFLWPKFN